MSKRDNGFTYTDGISLKTYVDMRCDAICKQQEERFDSIVENTTLARDSMNKRLEGMNEFRDALRDQTSKFVTRQEHEIALTEIRDLRESRAKLEGKASQNSVVIAYIIAGAGLLLSAINLVRMLLA